VNDIEHIVSEGGPIAYIIRAEFQPSQTTFLTPPDFKQQVGFVVYPKGGQVHRHTHRALKRNLTGTSEVVLVREGRCEVDLYSEDQEFVATRELKAGDILILVGGGHGFRMLEDTVLIEVKQGPYIGVDEKDLF
jgi:uncharacterized protein with PhoU and TrkA domain